MIVISVYASCHCHNNNLNHCESIFENYNHFVRYHDRNYHPSLVIRWLYRTMSRAGGGGLWVVEAAPLVCVRQNCPPII